MPAPAEAPPLPEVRRGVLRLVRGRLPETQEARDVMRSARDANQLDNPNNPELVPPDIADKTVNLNALLPLLTRDEIKTAFRREREVGAGQAVSQAQRVKDAQAMLGWLRKKRRLANSHTDFQGEWAVQAIVAGVYHGLVNELVSALQNAGIEVQA